MISPEGSREATDSSMVLTCLAYFHMHTYIHCMYVHTHIHTNDCFPWKHNTINKRNISQRSSSIWTSQLQTPHPNVQLAWEKAIRIQRTSHCITPERTKLEKNRSSPTLWSPLSFLLQLPLGTKRLQYQEGEWAQDFSLGIWQLRQLSPPERGVCERDYRGRGRYARYWSKKVCVQIHMCVYNTHTHVYVKTPVIKHLRVLRTLLKA